MVKLAITVVAMHALNGNTKVGEDKLAWLQLIQTARRKADMQEFFFPTRVNNTSLDKDRTVDSNTNMPMRTDNSTVELRGAGTPGKFDTHLTHPDTRREWSSHSLLPLDLRTGDALLSRSELNNFVIW